MADGEGITDAGVERLRARVGIARPHTQPPHYRFPNEDTFRHVAEAYGDDNPLWADPDYARSTRWATVPRRSVESATKAAPVAFACWRMTVAGSPAQ